MDDLISRQDVFDLIDNWDGLMIPKVVFRCNVEQLPSAEKSQLAEEKSTRKMN